MEIIAYCNSSCCPSIVFNEKDRSQPILIKDDFNGSLPLTLQEFDGISDRIANIQKTNVFPTFVSYQEEFAINAYLTDKPYIKITMTDAIGNTRKVKDISFDHWELFKGAIAKHYVTA